MQHPHILEVQLIARVIQDAGTDLAVALTRWSAKEEVDGSLLGMSPNRDDALPLLGVVVEEGVDIVGE